MTACAFIKPGGERCRGIAKGGANYCYAHDPARADERQRNAAKGGRRGGRGRTSKAAPGSELEEIKALLSELTDRVLGRGDAGSERIDTRRAAVANQLVGTYLRALELERKLREAEELEARLEALEETMQEQPKKGARA